MYARLPADAPRDPAATIDHLVHAALAGLPLTDAFPMTVDRHKPSAVRVFGKSLHMLAAGWAAAILWLWGAGMRQYLIRDGVVPADLGLGFLLLALGAGVALAACASWIARKTGGAPYRAIEREEWRLAFWWSIVPNGMLLVTTYLIVAWAY